MGLLNLCPTFTASSIKYKIKLRNFWNLAHGNSSCGSRNDNSFRSSFWFMPFYDWKEFDNVTTTFGNSRPLCLRWTGNTVRTEPYSKRISFRLCWQEMQKCFTAINLKYQNNFVQILIGLDNAKVAVPMEVRKGKWKEPIASRTRLGWTIPGGRSKKT